MRTLYWWMLAIPMHLSCGWLGSDDGCTKDSECKGDRICAAGSCTDPVWASKAKRAAKKGTIPVLRDANTQVDPMFLSDPEEYMAMSGNYGRSLEGLTASSALPQQGKNRYEANRMSDWDTSTAWVEGDSAYGVGESISFTWRDKFDDHSCTGMSLMNGYQKSQKHMKQNSRVRTMDMYVDNSLFRRLEIQDRMGQQHFSLEALGVKDGQRVKLEITGVYKGTKWKDTSISELTTTCVP
jgi:hypothetical protein